jgi:hypothetical protein
VFEGSRSLCDEAATSASHPPAAIEDATIARSATRYMNEWADATHGLVLAASNPA